MNRKNLFRATCVMFLATSLFFACKKSKDATPSSSTTTTTGSTTSTTSTTSSTTSSVPDIYKKIYGATSVTLDGDYVVIQSKGMPDHKSPYYKGTQWESTMYEAYNGTNPKWSQNNGMIGSQNLTFRIPLHPAQASTHSSTPLGPMGISLNGVAFFNQYNGQHQKLTDEINSFDQYNGHPAPGPNIYHYHAEPLYLTTTKGKDALLGFLLDGFPVYGPQENGKTITNTDLDAYHGHFAATADYPNGIYHYHITAEDPYINGDGFYGTPGTVTQ